MCCKTPVIIVHLNGGWEVKFHQYFPPEEETEEIDRREEGKGSLIIAGGKECGVGYGRLEIYSQGEDNRKEGDHHPGVGWMAVCRGSDALLESSANS